MGDTQGKVSVLKSKGVFGCTGWNTAYVAIAKARGVPVAAVYPTRRRASRENGPHGATAQCSERWDPPAARR